MARLRGRIDLRIAPDDERKLRAAAQASHARSISAFVLSTALEHADEILVQRTLVPGDYFEALLAALDEPARPIPELAATAAQPRPYTRSSG